LHACAVAAGISPRHVSVNIRATACRTSWMVSSLSGGPVPVAAAWMPAFASGACRAVARAIR
jgi:hypothetical protein